jgi:hypothetical protein
MKHQTGIIMPERLAYSSLNFFKRLGIIHKKPAAQPRKSSNRPVDNAMEHRLFQGLSAKIDFCGTSSRTYFIPRE